MIDLGRETPKITILTILQKKNMLVLKNKTSKRLFRTISEHKREKKCEINVLTLDHNGVEICF